MKHPKLRRDDTQVRTAAYHRAQTKGMVLRPLSADLLFCAPEDTWRYLVPVGPRVADAFKEVDHDD